MTGSPALSLVMPMAGRGSRFAREGVLEPKPLIDLEGRPFFWWAAESVLRATPVGEMIFVVLEEHCAQFDIERRIHAFYPQARVLALPEVTSGAAETARRGLEALARDGPVAINDCDHAFLCTGLERAVADLRENTAGALLCFRSDSPAYSYAELSTDGGVVGTVEKKVVSSFAIAGCYLVNSPRTYFEMEARYREHCPYDELFVSGVYNEMAARGLTIAKVDLQRHFSFGIPEEKRVLDGPTLKSAFGLSVGG